MSHPNVLAPKSFYAFTEKTSNKWERQMIRKYFGDIMFIEHDDNIFLQYATLTYCYIPTAQL